MEKIEKLIFSFANEIEKTLGIETAIHSDGTQVKRIQLSDGKQATVRELLGRDCMAIDKMIAISNDSDKESLYMNALFHYSVEIDNKKIPLEDFATLKMKDYSKIKVAVQALNF